MVGNWESVFGEDYSADSLVDSINAAWRNENDNEEGDDIGLTAMAYGSSAELKAELLKIIAISDAAKNSGPDKRQFGKKEISLPVILGFNDGEYVNIEKNYRIPASIVEFIDQIFRSMSPRPDPLIESARWLYRCFKAIQPGMDLSCVILEFMALQARLAVQHAHDTTERDRLQPACDILVARSRGVFLPQEIAENARILLEKTLGAVIPKGPLDWVDCRSLESNQGSGMDSAPLFLVCALAERYIDALNLIGYAHFSPRLSPVADGEAYWKQHAHELIDIIKTAPLQPFEFVKF